MGKATITVEDCDDGTIDINVALDPQVPKGPHEALYGAELVASEFMLWFETRYGQAPPQVQ